MAGRTPKPTNLKLIEGNRGKRAANKQEPDPIYLQDLTAPAWLAPAAVEVWNEIAPQLRAAHLLTEVDVELLAMGCVSIAQYRQAVRRCGEDLVKCKMVEPESGEGDPVAVGEHINPWAIVQSMSFKQAMQVFQQFGMSPAARTRIAVQPQGDLFGNGQGKTGKGYLT